MINKALQDKALQEKQSSQLQRPDTNLEVPTLESQCDVICKDPVNAKHCKDLENAHSYTRRSILHQDGLRLQN